MSSKLPASTEDWDFESVEWDLDTVIYRSAPSSLRWKDYAAFRVVCKTAICVNVPMGRIESWFYKAGSSYQRKIGFVSRIQYPDWAKGYAFFQTLTNGIGNELYYVYRDGVLFKSGAIAQPPVDTWFKRRLTFWESGGWLILRYETWDGSSWVKEIADVLDPSPLYGSSSVNRCGLYLASHGSVDQIRADDTVIYKPS
jgi:hypothetical protein